MLMHYVVAHAHTITAQSALRVRQSLRRFRSRTTRVAMVRRPHAAGKTSTLHMGDPLATRPRLQTLRAVATSKPA